jgi:hypothetical protein
MYVCISQLRFELFGDTIGNIFTVNDFQYMFEEVTAEY